MTDEQAVRGNAVWGRAVRGREVLRDEVLRDQYADDVRLSARQSLWRQRTGPSLYQKVLSLAALTGTEVVVDVGCGNGRYLAELERRGHTGTVLGFDLSPAMARLGGAHAPTVVADAQALPLRAGGADVALSMHMLYHVPDVDRAIAQLRRVVRPGGLVVVGTNGPGHTAEIKAVLARACAQVAAIEADQGWDTRRFAPKVARTRLARVFDTVEVHEFGDALRVSDPDLVRGYLASWPPAAVGLREGEVWQRIVAVAGELIEAHLAEHASFTITSRVAVLLCR